MRKIIGLSSAFVVCVACGSQGVDGQPLADAGGGSEDGGGLPDDRADAASAPVDAASAPDGDGPPPRGFQIRSKDVVIQPFQEVTFCYHFAVPNTETLAIRKWKSEMPSVVRSLAVYIGGTQEESDTISAAACPSLSNASTSDIPLWVYSSHQPKSELAFPSDDGMGKPLGFELPPGKKAYIRMQHLNTTDAPVTAHVTLSAEALPEGAEFTKTSTFVTYDASLSIPAFTTNHVEGGTCDTLPDTTFWSMSMQAHKQAVKMTVKSGTTVAYETLDWDNPLQKTWPAAPFFAFAQDKLTYECTYTNPTSRTISSGGNSSVDEECVTAGYFFPATKPVLCFCIEAGCVNF